MVKASNAAAKRRNMLARGKAPVAVTPTRFPALKEQNNPPPAISFVDRDPAICLLSGESMRWASRKFVVLSAVVATAICAAWLLLPKSVNAYLRERGIPAIPDFESRIGVEAGGFFASWLFVAVRATAEQMDAYEARLLSDGAEHFALGDRTGQVKIIGNDEPEINGFSSMSNPEMRPQLVFQEVGSAVPRWWNTHQATLGEYLRKELQSPRSYYVILDREHGIIYVYWHHS